MTREEMIEALGSTAAVGYSHIPGVKLTFPLLPYEVDVDGTTEYTRYTSGKMTNLRGVVTAVKDIIYKKSVEGTITRYEKAYDKWENRKTATYIPVNDPFDGTGATTYQ